MNTGARSRNPQGAETRDGSGSASTWAPLRIRLFRTLWIAVLVSNVGTWMQTVGAQWLLVDKPHAAVLVSLVQTASTLPAVLFALVGGVLADIFDRVKLLVAVLAGMTAAGGALAALTAAHRMTPALLLMFTFILAPARSWSRRPTSRWCPTWSPARWCPAASALSSINVNLARAIGPAIAGLLIARIGAAAVVRPERGDVPALRHRGGVPPQAGRRAAVS